MPAPKQEKPQKPFLPSDSFPYFHLTEVDNPGFARNITSNTANEVDENQRKREPEAQKRRQFSSLDEKEQSESSQKRTKRKPTEEKALNVPFTAESSTTLPPPASSNHKNILMMNESRRSLFTADEERRRESSMIPLSTTASLLVGESTSRANTRHIHSPRRKERKDEEMPFLQLGRGYDDTLPVNSKHLVHSCNTGLAERNEHSSEKQSRSFNPDPSLQAFDAQQTSKKNLFREYPTMSSGPFHSYTTSDEDRAKQIASLQFNNAESHDKDTSIAKQVSSNKKTDIDPSQMLLLQGGGNTFSLSSKNNSAQEVSACKPMIRIESHEDMNKLIDAFFSSDDMMKSTFNVSRGKQEPKKDIVTYKFPLKLYFMVASGHFENIIKWTSKGKAFQIMNKDKFVKEVLPLVFAKAAKFSSFHRKLNRWKFEKVQKEMNTWMHPLFQQDRPDLCRKICATNSTIEQYISVQDLMMRNQGNASVQQQGKNHQQEVLVAPVTRNDVPSFPYYCPLTLFQNNLGSTQNFSIQNMQSSVYNPNQYMLLPTNLQQQGQQAGQQGAPVAIGMLQQQQQGQQATVAIGGMQQQQGLSNLPMSNQYSQMTQLGMTADANRLEQGSIMLHNQIPSTYAGAATASTSDASAIINSSGGMAAFDIMTRNDSSFANTTNSGYMNKFDVKFSNLKKEGIHHTGQVSTSSCRDTMIAQNFLPLPPNLQNRPNLSATNEQIVNTSNLVQQTPNEAYASSVDPFGTNLVSSNTPSISGFSSSVLGSDSQITNGGLGSESSHGDITSAGMGLQQSFKPTTGGDSLIFSRDPIESRALEEGPDHKTDETTARFDGQQ